MSDRLLDLVLDLALDGGRYGTPLEYGLLQSGKYEVQATPTHD